MLSALAAHADFLQVLPQLASYGAGCLLKEGTSMYRRMQVGGRRNSRLEVPPAAGCATSARH
jgi:hypothetical protein